MSSYGRNLRVIALKPKKKSRKGRNSAPGFYSANFSVSANFCYACFLGSVFISSSVFSAATALLVLVPAVFTAAVFTAGLGGITKCAPR